MTDITFTDSNFQEDVIKSDRPVLVDFWAPWCGPCKIVDPIVHELAGEYEGKLKVGKMNVDDNPEVSGQLRVMSIPTLMFFKNGQPVKSLIGAQGKDTLKQAAESVLA